MKNPADLRKRRFDGWLSSSIRGQLADFLRTDRRISLPIFEGESTTATGSCWGTAARDDRPHPRETSTTGQTQIHEQPTLSASRTRIECTRAREGAWRASSAATMVSSSLTRMLRIVSHSMAPITKAASSRSSSDIWRVLAILKSSGSTAVVVPPYAVLPWGRCRRFKRSRRRRHAQSVVRFDAER